ncbi:hypothetical protein AB4212_51625 [Streptomyces sp. 2MCAF27]
MGAADRETQSETDAGAELARRVFTGDERWGWEFVQPPEPPAHWDAYNPPAYTEPSGAEVRAMEERVMAGRQNNGSGWSRPSRNCSKGR